MHNATQKWLVELLQCQSLPASTVPKAAKPDIANLVTTGFIHWEKSGGGARYHLGNAQAVNELLEASGYLEDHQGLTPKAIAVARHGDAHRGRDDAMLLMLSTAGQPRWHNQDVILDVRNQVNQFGIASLVVRPGDNWVTDEPVALVENLDLAIYGKQYFERIGFHGSILYYSGWISKALLDWLSESNRSPGYTIFPDYDLVGIKNYLVAKQRLGPMLNIHIPDNLPELLNKFGNSEKLQSQTDRALIEKSKDKDALYVYRALLESGKGIDQEILMLSR